MVGNHNMARSSPASSSAASPPSGGQSGGKRETLAARAQRIIGKVLDTDEPSNNGPSGMLLFLLHVQYSVKMLCDEESAVEVTATDDKQPSVVHRRNPQPGDVSRCFKLRGMFHS